MSKKIISEACGPILIKFYVKYQWVGGLVVLGFGADRIKIEVSMAIVSSHRLSMGKNLGFHKAKAYNGKKSSSLKPQKLEIVYLACNNV